MIRLLAALLFLAAPAAAQSCFMDVKDPAAQQRVQGALQRLVVAHVPIEYRNSCGLRDETDQAFYTAIRDSVQCTDSQTYGDFFGSFLQDQPNYLFARGRTDFRTDDSYREYCEMVGRIDLAAAVREDGTLNSEMIRAQFPLFQAIDNHSNEHGLE